MGVVRCLAPGMPINIKTSPTLVHHIVSYDYCGTANRSVLVLGSNLINQTDFGNRIRLFRLLGFRLGLELDLQTHNFPLPAGLCNS